MLYLSPMYDHVAVFTLDGQFLGYSIKDANAQKLQTTNLYSEAESEQLVARLQELNDGKAILAVWPNARDPEVEALVNDPSFHPVEMVEDDVIDEDNSYIVHIKEPEADIHGNLTGEMIDGGIIDQEASVIVYKKMRVPARPSDYMERTKAACEAVARQRAGT